MPESRKCSRDSVLTRAKTQPGERFQMNFVGPVFLSCLALQRARGRLLIDAFGGVDWRRWCLSSDDVYCE